MFHSILPDTSKEDNWSWEWNKFDRMCFWIKEQVDKGELTVYTTEQMFRQMEH